MCAAPEHLADAMANLEEENIVACARKMLDEGYSVSDIQEAMNRGMKRVGDYFEQGEYFIADLMVSGMFYKMVLDMLPVGKAPMMLVVNSSEMNGEKAVLDVVGKYARYYKVKSRNLSKGRLDLVIELKVKEESALVSEVAALDGMISASMISHDGEVTF